MARVIGLLLTEGKPPVQQETYICPHCGKVYKSAAALKTHVAKAHPQVFDDTE